MKLIRPTDFLKAERVIAVTPKPSTYIRECRNRRLNYYTGRVLTHTALNVEQHHHSGHLGMYGSQLSPGTVFGLDVGYRWTPVSKKPAEEAVGGEVSGAAPVVIETLEAVPEPSPDRTDIVWEFHISAGLGLTIDGEDVCLSQPLDVEVNKIPVIDRPTDLPRGLGVLVLQPIVADSAGDQDEKDPCELDPENDAYEDWQLVDGCRLVWYPWPSVELALPPSSIRFRNEVTYTIFTREQHPDGKPLPWEPAGVPLAMAYINRDGAVTFVDRCAVVRQGGAPRALGPRVPGGGTPYLWQARIQAFSEHMQQLQDQGKTIEEAIRYFRFLPPAGFFPKALLNFETFQTPFFLSHYDIKAVPVPLEQLEIALEATAGMAPFDLFDNDHVKILVPVPQELYEPRLLKQEQVAPVFAQTINDILAELGVRLGRRQALRGMVPVVYGAIDPQNLPEYAAPDPEAVTGEVVTPMPDGDEEMTGHGALATEALKALHQWLNENVKLTNTELASINPADMSKDTFIGVAPFISALEKKINTTNDRIDFGFLRLQTDIYRVRQIMLGSSEASRLATSPVLATIAEGETNFATQENLKTYFDTVKTARADAARSSAAPLGTVGRGSAESVIFPGGIDARISEDVDTIIESGKKRASFADIFGISRETMGGVDIKAASTSDEILGKDPIVGEVHEFRSTTIADRISQPKELEAKSFAVATKASILSNFSDPELDIKLDDIEVTLAGHDTAILSSDDYENLDTSKLSAKEKTIFHARGRKADDSVAVFIGPLTPSELKSLEYGNGAELTALLTGLAGKNKGKLTKTGLSKFVLAGWLDPDPLDGDEAAFLSRGVTALESSIAVLRKIEGRISSYRKAVEKCKKTLATLSRIAGALDTDLKAVDDIVAEYRHDVTVARALFEEEKGRISAINNRRADILENHVPFLVFMRIRTTSLRLDAPSFELYGVFEDPVPACLKQTAPAPDELQDMLDLFRDIPLKWLPFVRQLVIKLDRPELLKSTFYYARQKAKLRASQPLSAAVPQFLVSSSPSTSKYGQTISKVLTAYQQTTYTFMREKSILDLQSLDRMSWKEASRKAQEDLSLSDLIESGKGRSDLARRASSEMEHLEDVAVCFYARCGDVTPALRLQWAEKISAFDQPINLKNLDALPGWDTVDFEMRRDLQRLVDWLFSRVDAGIPEAVALLNDLVRVCILLAGHAPVTAIISGHVSRPAAGKVGDVIDLDMDKGKVRVGMRVAVFSDLDLSVQGIVEDLSESAARVKVTHSKQATFQVEQGAKAQFFPATAPLAFKAF